MLSTRGTVLKLYPMGEHGLIVCTCTADWGMVRAVARNARKAGSELFGHIDLFYDCELLLSPAKTGDLHTLKSAKLTHARLGLRKKLARLRLASYLSQLMLRTTESEHEQPSWHQLISGALDYLAEREASLRILTHFEKRLAQLHGLYSEGVAAHLSLAQHFHLEPHERSELIQSLSS